MANVPIASGNNFGVVKIDSSSGVQIKQNGTLDVRRGTSETYIKQGTHGYMFVPILTQHISTFYGLAKAAGDATQSVSSNAVGAYTDDAKVAIQKMLGIYEPPWELLNDITLSEIGGIDVSADDNGVPYDLLSVYMYILYPANAESISSGYSRFRFYDDASVGVNNFKVYAETGKYTTATALKFKHIYLTRVKNMVMVQYTTQALGGGHAQWYSKLLAGVTGSNGGISFNCGTIKRIMQATDDAEPAGTRFLIYGQRAY